MGTLVEDMLESIENDTSAYSKFILDYKKYENATFYFVEGEDFFYYNKRIKKYSKSKKHRNYSCGGKKNVISVRNMIANSNIKLDSNNKIMFFVDRDYNFDSLPEDIYTTEWYSIENFYLTKELIKKVLENYFCLNEDDTNYIKALEVFDKLYKEYSKVAKKLNIFYYTVRECEMIQGKTRTDLNKIPFYKFIMQNGLEKFKMKEFSYCELAKMYEISCELNEELLNKNEHIFCESNHYNFRGKFELEFLKYFLDLIRRAMKDGKCGFVKIKVCGYDFKTDTMNILSEYAYTSESLKEYIKSSNIKELKKVEIQKQCI